jgi:GT2 family glycosyltransferase
MKVTVVFLLYNAGENTAALIDAIRAQKHPRLESQTDWLNVVFMDDHSSDDTLAELRRALARIDNPPNYHVEVNPTNLGLAGTLNKALQLVRTPYALTCHLDCFFGSETYVAEMVELMDRHPEAAAISGQPALPMDEVALAEKVNLISNLMPVLPGTSGAEVEPVGFAEGRCDIFRVEVLRAVGFYDTSLRVAGEDQLLAGKLRQAGYEIYRAARLEYFLRASGEQDSIRKLVKHVFRFGKVHPFIVVRQRRTTEGIVGRRAGTNLQTRTLLRGWQVVSVAAYLTSAGALLVGARRVVVVLPVAAALGGKLILFARHLRFVAPAPRETVVLFAVQPLLDVAYVAGLLQGGWLMLVGSPERPIT